MDGSVLRGRDGGGGRGGGGGGGGGGGRGEASGHGPCTTGARYEDGRWTVRFYVDETGMVGGRPTDRGKEVATVELDDETWVVDSVQTGDRVGGLMARGVSGAYGKQANYPWVWGPLALAFALAFVRTDRLFSLRNLAVAGLPRAPRPAG